MAAASFKETLSKLDQRARGGAQFEVLVNDPELVGLFEQLVLGIVPSKIHWLMTYSELCIGDPYQTGMGFTRKDIAEASYTNPTPFCSDNFRTADSAGEYLYVINGRPVRYRPTEALFDVLFRASKLNSAFAELIQDAFTDKLGPGQKLAKALPILKNQNISISSEVATLIFVASGSATMGEVVFDTALSRAEMYRSAGLRVREPRVLDASCHHFATACESVSRSQLQIARQLGYLFEIDSEDTSRPYFTVKPQPHSVEVRTLDYRDLYDKNGDVINHVSSDDSLGTTL